VHKNLNKTDPLSLSLRCSVCVWSKTGILKMSDPTSDSAFVQDSSSKCIAMAWFHTKRYKSIDITMENNGEETPFIATVSNFSNYQCVHSTNLFQRPYFGSFIVRL
jgi:hypothetical protein